MSDEKEVGMADGGLPAFYALGPTVKATFADGYSGWVVDLGDGTCRLANQPLLGENGPKFGDRVDLFYNPCNAFERPRIGYRIYGDGEEPVGRQFGRSRTPTDDEIAEHEEEEERRDAEQVRLMEEHMDARFARLDLLKARNEVAEGIVRYAELLTFARENGLKVPDNLHSEEVRQQKIEENDTPERRKEMKLYLLAAARVEYEDVQTTAEEEQEAVDKRLAEDKFVDGLINDK